MTDITIRKAIIDDIITLQLLGKQTYVETFMDTNSSEDMKIYLDTSFSIEQLTKEFHNLESDFYIAWNGDAPIGYIKLNWGNAQNEFQHDHALEVQRIYVLSNFHGKSIGQLLLDQAIKVASHKNVDYIWLGVWEHNHKAIHFYKKNGFSDFDQHVFMLGTDRQIDILMKCSLLHDILSK